MTNKACNVGVIGLGTIGTGVVKVLLGQKELLAKRCGRQINLKAVAEISPVKKDGIDYAKFTLTDDASQILNDDGIDVVVEVIGGIDPAKEFLETALRNRKHVVTANKELIAKHGAALLDLARTNRVNLCCEASSGGGVPIIHALTSSLAANSFKKIYGILNGTTNYILTKMYNEGADFEEVLKEAQELGYAEADPSSDVGGHDVAYKLSILGSIAFDSRFDVQDIFREGIHHVSCHDIEIAREFGYVIKLLAIGISHDEEHVELRVHPVMLPVDHPLAAVNESFNAVYVEGDSVGETMFYGRGAGELPTASAVVGDIVSIARGMDIETTTPALNFELKKKKLIPMGEVVSKYYLRLIVTDRAGVLAAISKVFGDNEVSIRMVQQKDFVGNDAELVIMTHAVKESRMRKALAAIKELDVVTEICALIRTDL